MKLRTKRLLAPLFLALLSAFLALPITGCAAVAALMPDVIAAVTDGSQILDAIAGFVASYFANHPDADAQKKVAEAITKARSALNVALRTAQGTKNLDDAKIDAAFEDFKQAYLELMTLVKPYGVHQSALPHTRFTATSGQLIVPEPMAFHPKAGK